MTKDGTKRELKQERAARTRVELLDAAIRLFATRGFLATTMAELAKAIKMTPGALYWHFPTKEDLLLGALQELNQRIIAEFADLLSEGRRLSASEQLTAVFARSVRFLRRNPEYSAFFSSMTVEGRASSERVAAAIRGVLDRYAETFANVVRHGQKKTGEFRKDLDATRVGHSLLGCHVGLMAHHNLFRERMDYEPMAWVLHALVLKGLAA